MDQCLIGDALGEDCNVISEGFSRRVGFHNIADLSIESQQLLTLRSGVSITASDNTKLCFHHEKCFISRYESLQKFCCDPFMNHKKNVTSNFKLSYY